MNDKQAEDFVRRYAYYLFSKEVYFNLTRPRDEYKVERNVEGEDWQSLGLLKGNGSVEVKWAENFITRDNNAEPTGTIGFELFQRYEVVDKYKMYQGAFIAICNALWYTSIRQEIREKQIEKWGKWAEENVKVVTAKTPSVLAVILGDDNQDPFCCVAFEDIPALVMRLCKICPDAKGWGLTDPDAQIPATNRAYWQGYEWQNKHKTNWNSKRGHIIKNAWHVPLGEIIDLATVTMLNGEPRIPQKAHVLNTTTAETQQQRLNTLKQKAEERGEMERLIPEKADQELEKVSGRIGIPAERISRISYDALRELQDADKLAEIRAQWEQETGVSWEQHNRQMIERWGARNTDQAEGEKQ